MWGVSAREGVAPGRASDAEATVCFVHGPSPPPMDAPKNVSRALARSAAETLKALGSNEVDGLSKAEAARRFDNDGPNEVPDKPRHPLLRFAKRFWGLSAWMIEAIAVISFFLHKYADMWIALSLLVANAVLGFFQEQRASSAIAALRKRLEVSARVLRDKVWQAISARALVAGDVVRVRAGDLVPADLQLLGGDLSIDQSALTGESNEVEEHKDATLYAGSTVRGGEATGVVIGTGVKTYFGRTTQLVAEAHPTLHVEKVIARVVRWLLLIVGALAAVTFVVALVQGVPLLEVLPIVLVLLMSAIPVALPVMFTVTMAVGSMELGRHGVLITQLRAIEDAANMDVLCADKTGTLTMNRLSLTGTVPQPGFTAEDVMHAGALASNAANADPIDVAFLREAASADSTAKTISFQPFSAASRRTEAVVEIAGERFRFVKGALRTVAAAAGLDAAAIQALEARASEEAQKGVG